MILLWCLLFVYLIFLCGWFWVGPWADSSHLQILGVFGNWEEGFGDMTMNERKTIDLEQGWEFMQKGITKLKNILEGLPEPQFSSEDYMMLYTYLFQPHLVSAFVNILLLVIHNFFLAFLWYCFFFFSKKSVYRTIYNMCTQKPPHDYSQQLYDKYRESFEEYISATVGTWYCCNPNISVKCTLLIASELSLICL